MNDKRMLSGLAYLSIIFAPIVLPLIMLGVSRDPELRWHAKRALLLHLAPGVSLFVTVGILKSWGLVCNHQTSFPSAVEITFGILVLINVLSVGCAVIFGIKQFLH